MRKIIPPPPLELVKALIHYDPLTGEFRWKKATRGHFSGAQTAVRRRYHGHKGIKIDGQDYLAHRLAWYIVYGVWPPGCIDHINGDGGDNRISNLRLATESQNCQNRRMRSNNTSGFKGVYFYKASKTWRASISFEKKRILIGNFPTPEKAAAAYDEAAQKLFGQYALTNAAIAHAALPSVLQ